MDINDLDKLHVIMHIIEHKDDYSKQIVKIAEKQIKKIVKQFN